MQVKTKIISVKNKKGIQRKRFYVLIHKGNVLARRKFTRDKGLRIENIIELLKIGYKKNKTSAPLKYGSRIVNDRKKPEFRVISQGSNEGLVKTHISGSSGSSIKQINMIFPRKLEVFVAQLHVKFASELKSGRVIIGWGHSNLSFCLNKTTLSRQLKDSLIKSAWGNFCKKNRRAFIGSDAYKNAQILDTSLTIFR